ncbi:uncharacterized protein LOC117329546 [Pecten maximus]|uniref:uncharacterized protein LOC117329546 n=1 Tax=Pecten maximus TaxID=6579 RepID=UPI001457EABA|nr:uncharacterized protein LOC117329546 [Pecten maximus]
MLSRTSLIARQVGKSAAACQSVRHGSWNNRETAVKYNNDMDCLPIPQGSYQANYKAMDFRSNWQIAVLLGVNIALYQIIKSVYPNTDDRGKPTTYKIDPPVYDTYDN